MTDEPPPFEVHESGALLHGTRADLPIGWWPSGRQFLRFRGDLATESGISMGAAGGSR
jgi:hypothetical protein